MLYKWVLLLIAASSIMACNSNKITKMNVDYRIFFKAFHYDIKDNDLKSRLKSSKTALGILDTLKNQLQGVSNVSEDYKRYYNAYNRSLGLIELFEAGKSDCMLELTRAEEAIKKDTAFDFSLIQSYYLYYKYASVFQNEWYLQPRIEFSEEFVKTILANSLFREYLDYRDSFDDYDKNDSIMLKSLYQEGNSLIPLPVVIDSALAIELKNYINSRENLYTTSLLKNEKQMMEKLLLQVQNKEAFLLAFPQFQ